MSSRISSTIIIFFFNSTAATEIYTLSLHDALPIYPVQLRERGYGRPLRGTKRGREGGGDGRSMPRARRQERRDRKSTRLNSSHTVISYAVFCLKKKKSCPCRVYRSLVSVGKVWSWV